MSRSYSEGPYFLAKTLLDRAISSERGTPHRQPRDKMIASLREEDDRHARRRFCRLDLLAPFMSTPEGFTPAKKPRRTGQGRSPIEAGIEFVAKTLPT